MKNGDKDIRISDEHLVEASLSGDLTAFGELVDRYWEMVLALALGRLRGISEAEDAAQECFISAYAQLNRLRDPSRFAGWLSRIVLQCCTDAVRRNKRHRSALAVCAKNTEEDVAITAYSSNPGLTQSQIQFVRTCIHQLPAKARDLVLMRFVGGLSSVQIAQQLGHRPGTIRVRLHRAYQRLRQDLAPLLEEVDL